MAAAPFFEIPAKTFSMAEVAASATSPTDAMLVIDGMVWSIGKFAPLHPGGKNIIMEYAGKDATKAFFEMHRTEVLFKYPKLCIGRLEGVAADKVGLSLHAQKPGAISKVPYAEHSSLQGWKSPYHTEKHLKYRTAVRAFYETHVAAVAAQNDIIGKTPSLEMFQKLGAAGLLAARLSPPQGRMLALYEKEGIPCPGGIAWKDFDCFCEAITHEEHGRFGSPSYCDGLGGGFSIGVPCIVNYASQALFDKVMPDIIKGNKRACLAISEPQAGSDVAGLVTRAEKSPCGKFYIVTGQKKWITSGLDCDWFVTAVRTGGEGSGMMGLTMLLIEKGPGLTTSQIKTSYDSAAGTALVTYDHVKVPVENILGEEDAGFKPIMANFNHERWMIVVFVLAACRSLVRDCFLWAKQRMVFGKPLLSQPIIQSKLADMSAQVESLSAQVDYVTYQLQNHSYKQQMFLGGPIALLKARATKILAVVANHATQIFGGRAITKTGMGRLVENAQRSFKYAAILGGSEEILETLAIKQAIRLLPKDARL